MAWKRRLIFTVGTSSTTGETDTVVWNEIHHKTEMDRNVTGHGYPDPNYLQNVLAELAALGQARGVRGPPRLTTIRGRSRGESWVAPVMPLGRAQPVCPGLEAHSQHVGE